MASDAQAYAALVSSSLGAARGLPSDSGANNTFLSNEDSLGQNCKLPKTRKPYTITKQRERWSEEEHLRFVEALRLYGRAWRKIEEHIGTKTAVQIRSHAQKFFNKLERKKEAGEVPDKEENFTIPPPRPKRKPAKPYPRKDGLTSSEYTGTSQLQMSPQMHAAQQQLPPGVSGFSLGPASTGHQHMGMLAGLQHSHSTEVTDATVAAVTAAASAAAAAAAAAVVAAAGQEVQTHMQVHPPSCFPFFGMPPSALAQITPNGVSALDQAALLAQHTAAAKAEAAFCGFGGIGAGGISADGTVPAVPAGTSASPGRDIAMLGENGNGSDRGLVEATGTTDGTHISANAQLRGSDGDSACSRETDNQDVCPSLMMDASWQSKLLHPALQQQQQEMGSSSPSAAAARSLAGLQAGGFDPSQLQWGMGRCFDGSSTIPAAAGLPGLQGFNTAQALALLSNPLYMAAADRQYQQAALEAAAAVAAGMGVQGGATAGRSSGGVAASSGERGGGGRTKSRRTAPSVNSGSTGPPLGTKRALQAASEECDLPAKKPARELSDTGEEAEGMEVSPSSPSIQEKELKAASQPSNTNGNTSGSNESDASKRRQGTTQGEGSNPTNGNSSGNGYSVKDSNTGTNTGTNCHTNGNGHGYSCGNGTSAFNPVGHHQYHHSHQQPARTNNYSSNQQQTGTSVPSRPHNHHYHLAHNGEGSNGGNGASGTGLSARDEGRSSSDLEGPLPQLQLQQQLQQQCLQDDEDELMEEPDGVDEQEDEHVHQQQSEQAAQLQAIMASLHGMCGNPLMLQQAYGAAAAAAATAQQIVANAMHNSNSQHALPVSNHSHLAATLQQLQRQGGGITQAPPVSQGFAPWHGSAASDFGSSASFIGNGLLQQHIAGNGTGMNSHGASAALQLQLQAAAGLVGLASKWDSAASAASAGVSGDVSTGGLYNSQHCAQLAGSHYYHHHHHHHHHQQQAQAAGRQQLQAQQQAHQRLSEILPSLGGNAAAVAAVGLQQLQQGLGPAGARGSNTHLGSLAGVLNSHSGLDALGRNGIAADVPTSEGGNGVACKRVISKAAN